MQGMCQTGDDSIFANGSSATQRGRISVLIDGICCSKNVSNVFLPCPQTMTGYLMSRPDRVTHPVSSRPDCFTHPVTSENRLDHPVTSSHDGYV